MRLAGADFVIWLIIFLVVAASKAWSKFQEQGDDDSPPPAPKPPAAKRPPRPRPIPQAQPMPRPVERRAPPAPRPAAAGPEDWGGGGELRDFMEQLQRKLQPQPVAAPPPVAKATPPPVKQTAALPAPISPAAPAQPPKQPTAAPPPQPSRAAQWIEALRDKQNIRNIIISAEIIGPPKGA